MKARPKPTVSVIIPVTKPHPFLLATLESVRKQTYKDFEILIGNASGVRAVGGTLRRYAKRRNYVRVYTLAKGKNRRTAFNLTVRHARGRFIARIDPGDIATKTRIAKQVAYLTDHPLVVAVGGQMRPYKKYARISLKPLPTNHDDIYSLSFLSLAMNPSTIMVNRNKLPQSFRWYNQSLEHIQEFDLIFHLMEYGQLANLPDVVAMTHNVHPLKHVVARGQRLVEGARVVFHAITRYGLSPSAKGLARGAMRLLF